MKKNSNLFKDANEATRRGMSYGTYMYLKESGRLPKPAKDKHIEKKLGYKPRDDYEMKKE